MASRYGEAITLRVRMRPIITKTGFLRRCYDDWVADADWYRQHPEEKVDPEYLKVPPFEEFVANIAEERLREFVEYAAEDDAGGFKIEAVPEERE